MDVQVVFLRFLVAFAVSFIYGFYRQRTRKPIGFGTFIFVSIGSCGLTIIALDLGLDGTIPLLSAIVTGIGFLGAGALIRNSDRVFGFTAAAAIWLFAILGMMIGLGEYINGAFVYLFVWIVVAMDKYLEKKGIGAYQRKLVIICKKVVNEKEVEKILAECFVYFKLVSYNLDKSKKTMSFNYVVEGKEKANFTNKIWEKEWFDSMKFE